MLAQSQSSLSKRGELAVASLGLILSKKKRRMWLATTMLDRKFYVTKVAVEVEKKGKIQETFLSSNLPIAM